MLNINIDNLKELENAMEEAELDSIEELINHIKATKMIYSTGKNPVGYMEICCNGDIYVELKEGYKLVNVEEKSGDSFEVHIKLQ